MPRSRCESATFDPETKRAARKCNERAVFEIVRTFSGITQLLCEQHHDGKTRPGVTVTRIGGWDRIGKRKR